MSVVELHASIPASSRRRCTNPQARRFHRRSCRRRGVRTARNCHNAAPLLDLEQSANWDKERGQDKAKPDRSNAARARWGKS